MHNTFLNTAAGLNQKNQAYATAIIVRRKIPSSGKPGDKAIITADGTIHGWIGGGCTRGIVLKEALMALQDRQPRMVYISPDAINRDEKGTKLYHMTCQSGGEVEVYIEPVLPKPQLRIFGKSHIAMALAKVSKAVEYQVDVVMTTADANVFPEADSLIELKDFAGKEEHASQYMIVCTQGERDAEALFAAINAKPQYLAFVASRRKANAIFSELRGMGVTFDQLKTIKTPAGLDIGAKTPHEVAISILAQIIQDFRAEPEAEQPATAEEKVVATMAGTDYYINPVCQVPVQKSTAKHVLEYKGESVYFCCDGCKVSFEKEPEKYMTVVEA
ncbi:MAG: XdhC family protein [Bacteroidota bacterium]